MTNKRYRRFWLLSLALLVAVGLLWLPGHARAGQDSPIHLRYSFPSVGIVRGEMLRVSVADVRLPPDPIRNELPPDPVRIFLLDTKGNRIGDSGEFLLPAVQSQFFDFHWTDIAGNNNNVADVPGSGRIQVRVVVEFTSKIGSPPDPCRPGVELIHEETGHTFALADPPQPDRL